MTPPPPASWEAWSLPRERRRAAQGGLDLTRVERGWVGGETNERMGNAVTLTQNGHGVWVLVLGGLDAPKTIDESLGFCFEI